MNKPRANNNIAAALSEINVRTLISCVVLCRMDAYGQQSGDDDYAPLTVMLSYFFTHKDNLFIQVETTAPPPRKKKRRSLTQSALHQ